ncbi:D-alanyl-D-alanine carboxypeptidase/D-alanyl-D-alanine-endopeptidase (penicillin-binding protein 4) [Dysgonomonas hofstadii]|uniref:D-alanyl-D-alanine carboxypeptidase/D-alanyl-D-alanine-endopeptidase (Penicillin-binding protein 4) n=1 Tax=Dysgonomonas hofstadii TaxID=637886 RepID=A0A840CMA1_9BACT|nr:D-alanyl-D-alanine carboxypeptidase/D-alanyl-D-alanine-endopeptidase [Dysgonomonas hofstadii]MBB4037177.1 D-alanyl-D-alanine carboxypeptidase/D-alanyl-D-alanine-endopeptidase (penicillin-binding protein 4) [Dysgonomonas hofstadii]
MKSKFQYLLLLLLLTPYILNAQAKQSAIQQFLNIPGLKHASVGICVKDMTGKQINGHNADKSYTPASILKVITTATALETLGADYRYKTTLSKDKDKENHLLIHGYGDPTLGTQHLENFPFIFLSEWEKQIKQNIDTTQSLDITVIDDYFGYDGVSQRWIYQDMGSYYAAAAYGISIFDNTYELYFNTTRIDTCPIITEIRPHLDIIFTNTLRTNTSGRDNGYIHGEPRSMKRLLTGNIPGGKTSFSIKGDIPNPGLCLGQTLATRLIEEGLDIAEVNTTYDKYLGQMYAAERSSFAEEIFYTHNSFPLKDIIKDTNVRSNNHYAEHLIRTVGRTKNKDIYSSALDEGIEKTSQLWKARGLNTDALMMFDGSGLSPSNAVSPAFMCDLLVYMQAKSKNAKTFLESLPQAGKDGTVRSRLRGTRLAGKIFMKSGSIYGVQCFAGYYINGDKKYAFTIMVNKFTGQRSQITKGIDNLLLALFP